MPEMTTQPTDEGKRRYDFANPIGCYRGTPCTCTPECDEPCKGQCGCEACAEEYADYLSELDI